MTTPLRLLAAAVLGIAITAVAAAQPPSDLSPAEMLARADADGDGTLDLEEFIKARRNGLEQNFARLDTDSNGRLDEKEIAVGAEQARAMFGAGAGGFRRPGNRPQGPLAGAMAEQGFERMDTDGDGKLSKEEFTAGMARLRELMQQGGPGRGGPRGGERGPEQGFRRPPRQE